MNSDTHFTPQKSTILIADDDPFARQMLRSLLGQEGHLLLEAESGDQALSIALAHLPDLVLLDIMMPNLDGFEVCARLRAAPQAREMPILLITSLEDRESRLRGLDIGADGFLSKPFDHAELLAQVRTITRLSRYRRLLIEQERYQRLVTLSPDGIAVVSATGCFLLVNPMLIKLLGVTTPEELLNQKVTNYLSPESIENYDKYLAALGKSTSQSDRGEITILGQHKNRLAVELSVSHFDGLEKNATLLIFRDITERKVAEIRTQRQVIQLTSLNTIGLAITASLELNTTLARLLDNMISHLPIDAASVLMVNSRTGLFEPAATKGINLPMSAHLLLRSDEGLAGIAFQTQQPVTAVPFTAKDVRCVRDRVLATRFGSYFALPLRARGKVLGVIELLRHDHFKPNSEWWLYVEALSVQAALAIHTATMFEQLQSANAELTYAYNATIEGWSHALDLRDQETEGHSVRVTDLTLRLAQQLRLPVDTLDHIRRGALLHDIGKMGVPDRILLKPGPLNTEEWAIMRQHPIYAYEWLSRIPFLHPALDIPYAHHERWDGSGYPCGLKGEQIPFSARIFAVVDVWDALRSKRPYRMPWTDEQVIAHLKQLSGVHFDPQIVQSFIDLLIKQKL